MFTGLVEEIGEVIAIEPVGENDSLRLTVAGPLVTSDTTHGASICVSGVCLTVVEQLQTRDGRGAFTADVMRQSLDMSALGDLRVGSAVNLERAVRADTRLGGHIVQGHVDGTATLLSITEHPAWKTLRFSLPTELAPLLVDKGSVTLSGVSLTVSAISDPPARAGNGTAAAEEWFEVSLIPETLTATTLGALAPGDRVNVETDVLARHVARMHHYFTAPSTTEGSPE